MTDNNNEETIHWEESTAHRDKFQNTNKAGAIKSGVKAINLLIKTYNNSIGFIPGVKKISEMDPEKTVAELAETGGSSFILGGIDDAIKLARFGISKINKWNILTIVEKTLLGIEFAIDHLKDLMTSTAISGLAAEVGDLKDGQAKLNSKVDAQGKLMNKRMGDLKTELQGELKQQGEKLENEIKDLDKRMAQATGENKQAIEEEKKQRQAQYQELKSSIQEVTDNLNRVETQLTNALNDFKSEVNERFEEQERKIIENKRRIEEERRAREAEVKEIKDKIKINQTNLENLRQEKEELEDTVNKNKAQFDQKTAETQQALEDTQAEYERKTKIIEAQIEDNQETIEEFNEQLTNVQREQAIQKVQQEEILENLQETNDTLFAQQRKLNLVAEQMDDIQEEVHERMDKLSQKLDDRISETLNIAKDTNQRIDNLTEEVQNIKETTEQLQEQIKKNKEETEQAKKEAKLANERLDNLLKTQALMDFSAEESKLDKIQKSLELKAEETKLLATLNLLQETKKLVQVELSEINWQVGIKEGTEREIPRPEGMLLNPNSSWAKKYTPEQLREWGWDTRLLGEHETAPLTDEDKRKEKQAQKNEQESQAAGEESTQTQDTIEKIEKLKSETLKRLATIQQEIRTGLEEIENSPSSAPPPKPSQTTAQQALQAQQKVRIKQKALEQQKEEEKKAQQQATAQPTKQNQKQAQAEKKETQKAERELEQAEAELSTLEHKQDFEEQLEEKEKELEENQSEEINQEWAQIQALSQQALQESQEKEKPEETKEEKLDKKLEELVQQLKEMEQSAAASQKTMTYFMLFLIIFLLEYVVYKRNGLPGLVVLNVILAVCYYHRDTLKEYADLWGKYLLIIGYVMGNILAYSAPEQEKYKWPSVAGFNLAVLGIYAYTLYQKYQAEKKIEAFYQQKSKEIRTERNITDQEWAKQEVKWDKNTWTGKMMANNPFSSRSEARFQEIDNLGQIIQEKAIAQQKEEEIQQQAEVFQKSAELEQQLKGNLEQIQEELGDDTAKWKKIHQWNKLKKTPPEFLRSWGWQNLKEKYPEFAGKSVLLEELNKKELNKQPADKETIKSSFTQKLTRLPVLGEEEQFLLSRLKLTIDQHIAISLKTPYLSKEQEEFIIDNYPDLELQAKLQLLSSGLNKLGINTYEKKEKLVELILTCQTEKEEFGLTVKEKENILRLLVNTLDLSVEQRESLESMGISFFDASNWQVSEEQKNHLLDFGINKLELTEEQSETLAIIHPDQFKTFSLTGEQKNILNSLAPLIREDKYSEESLKLLKSLQLKPNNSAFLVQEQTIPDPHTQFGVRKSDYLPLKIKFLGGEQKTLLAQQEISKKKLKEEEIKQNKLSILRSLMDCAQNAAESKENKTTTMGGRGFRSNPFVASYPIFLKSYNLSLTDWVNYRILTNWQTDILLTCGFKSVPKYNFFELLIFAVEKFAQQDWSEFLAGNEELAEEFQEYINSLKNPELTINETIWEKFVSSQSSQQREVIKNLNLKELVNEQVRSILGWTPTEPLSEDYSESKDQEQPETSSSRYDDLLAGLNEEETKRRKKQLEREEAQRKLQEQERARRESKLSEKDIKLKEQEERRQKEKELAELEEKKRDEARLAREKALQEEQDAYFSTKTKNIAERKKAVEEALENKKKENELEEQKKKDQIEKLEKENKEEQERLIKQSKLIEEEAQKRLAAIALEDEEQRQLIEKKAKEEKARIEAEILEVKRKNEEELKKKENELIRQREEQEAEIQKMEAAKRLAEQEEQTNKELYEKEMKSRQDLERQRANTLRITSERMDAQRHSEALRDNNAETALRSILWYPMLSDEWNRCVRGGNHFDKCPTVQDGFNRYSSLQVNPSLFQFDSGKWVNTSGGGRWTYSRADDLRKAVAICGNQWFTKSQLESHIKNSVGESF